MSPDPTRSFEDPAAAQQRFLSLFLRSEREIFRYVAAIVPNVADAEDIVQQTALELWENLTPTTRACPSRRGGCRFECDKELSDVTMALGINDQARLYLNGKDIYAFQGARTLELDADKGKVHLKKGVNVEVINEQNSWQGSMRFLDKTGAPVTDLKIKLSP